MIRASSLALNLRLPSRCLSKVSPVVLKRGQKARGRRMEFSVLSTDPGCVMVRLRSSSLVTLINPTVESLKTPEAINAVFLLSKPDRNLIDALKRRANSVVVAPLDTAPNFTPKLQNYPWRDEKSSIEAQLTQLDSCSVFLIRQLNDSQKSSAAFVRSGTSDVSCLSETIEKMNPSIVFHLDSSERLNSEEYSDWLATTSIPHHVFVTPDHILKQDAHVMEELALKEKNKRYSCDLIPLRIEQVVQLVDGKPAVQKSGLLSRKACKRDSPELADLRRDYKTRRIESSKRAAADVAVRKDKFHRVNQASGATNVVNTINVAVLGTGCHGTSPSVAVAIGVKSFLFNCGEVTQRCLQESRRNLKFVEHVFMTSANYENLAGLTSMLLSFEAWGSSTDVTIHGPPEIKSYLEDEHQFIRAFEDIELRNLRYDISNDDFEDSMRIEKVPISRDGSVQSMCYICHLPERPGAFDIKRARELGLKPGPIIKQIKDGNPVTLENGNVIRKEDVTLPSTKYDPFLVVDVPNPTMLDSFVNHGRWEESGLKPSLIVHLTPFEITQKESYQHWLQRFPGSRQMFLNESNSSPHVKAKYQMNYLLNRVSPAVFPLIHGTVSTPIGPSCNQPEESGDKIPVRANTMVDVWPKTGGIEILQKGLILDTIELEKNSKNSSKILDFDDPELAEIRRCIAPLEEKLSGPDFPRVVCLGTAASVAGRYRNYSGYLVQTAPSSWVLLDCGDCSYAEIVAHFGWEESHRVLANLHVIFLSHTHADHITGLPLLLKKRKESFDQLSVPQSPLLILSPVFKHKKWLHALLDRFIPGVWTDGDTVMLCEEALTGANAHSDPVYRAFLERCGLRSLETVPVDHTTAKSFASVLVTSGGGFKLVYSGDTLPCNDLVQAAQQCDLLIHEATHEESNLYEAFCAKHTTIPEAIEVHEASQSKFTLLTHFTGRFSKCPPLDRPQLSEGGIGIAFDHLDIRPKHYQLLPKLIPGYKFIFREHLKDLAKDEAAIDVLKKSIKDK